MAMGTMDVAHAPRHVLQWWMSAIEVCVYLCCMKWEPFHEGLWAQNWNLLKNLIAVIIIVMTGSGHKFAHVTTAQLSWHVQNYGLIGSLFFMSKQNDFL